jgi:2-keto-4-pentenoate hydratase/2-oxohepta-3-ene-1,7-dioic acid hydratase in catechol pathway
MKLVMFEDARRGIVAPGILLDDGVVTLHNILEAGTPSARMISLIDGFDGLRPRLHALAASADRIPLTAGALRAPIPRPGKVLGCIANYWEHARRDPRPLNIFLKNPDAVIGPGDTVRLPRLREPYAFMHEAELGIIIKGPATSVSRTDWRTAVFGYTAVVDVSARSHGRTTWRDGSWLGKSFDTFCPVGPVIVTADEVPDPQDLTVRFWVDGVLRHFYRTRDMEHPVPEIVEFASSVMTLNTGDLIACGTNHEGLGFIQHGERLRIEIEDFGAMELDVADPLRRRWEEGIYVGEDSVNHAAVRRHRPSESAELTATENPDGPAPG